MSHRRLLAVGALLALCGGVVAAGASPLIRQIIYAGIATDSTEVATRWVDVSGASRVYVRLWSGGTGVAADSAQTDSITTFRMYFSDSMANGFTAASDSVIYDPAAAATNDTVLMLKAKPLPIMKSLRSANSGSGIVVTIGPVGHQNQGTATGTPFDAGGVMPKRYMRIRMLPYVRLTTGGFSSTAGIRTQGVNALRVEVSILKENR